MAERRRLVMKKSMQLIAMFILSLATAAPAKIEPHQDRARELAAIEAKQQYVGAAGPYSSTTCSFTYSSGDDNKFMKYCVTANGNIAQFENPIAHEYIATTRIGEGYGVCDVDASWRRSCFFCGFSGRFGVGETSGWLRSLRTSSPEDKSFCARNRVPGAHFMLLASLH
jgi:hypothetical protein